MRNDIAIFTLHAYVKNFDDVMIKATAFNLSVSDINFHSKETYIASANEIFNTPGIFPIISRYRALKIFLCKSGLIMRYQNIIDDDENVCRHIELYGNASHPAPKDLYVSCPFHDTGYEGSAYRLEYLAIGKKYAYSRRYVFHVPQHEFIGEFLVHPLSFPPRGFALFVSAIISSRGWHPHRNVRALHVH